MKWIKWSEKIPDDWENKINRLVGYGVHETFDNSEWTHENDHLVHFEGYSFEYNQVEWLDESPEAERVSDGGEAIAEQLDGAIADYNYWKKRCEAAEVVIKEQSWDVRDKERWNLKAAIERWEILKNKMNEQETNINDI